MYLFVELDSMNNLKVFLNTIRSQQMIIQETRINKSSSIVEEGYSLDVSIRLPKKVSHDSIAQSLADGAGVFFVEEIE